MGWSHHRGWRVVVGPEAAVLDHLHTLAVFVCLISKGGANTEAKHGPVVVAQLVEGYTRLDNVRVSQRNIMEHIMTAVW